MRLTDGNRDPDVRGYVRLVGDRPPLLAKVVAGNARRNTSPEPGGGNIVLLKRDFPLAWIEREELVYCPASDAVSAKTANNEELGHQAHLSRQVADKRESHRVRAAIEQVHGSIRADVEERQQLATVEPPVLIRERPSEPRRPVCPTELREIVAIELPETLDDRSSLRGQGLQGDVRRNPRRP